MRLQNTNPPMRTSGYGPVQVVRLRGKWGSKERRKLKEQDRETHKDKWKEATQIRRGMSGQPWQGLWDNSPVSGLQLYPSSSFARLLLNETHSYQLLIFLLIKMWTITIPDPNLAYLDIHFCSFKKTMYFEAYTASSETCPLLQRSTLQLPLRHTACSHAL